MIRISDTLYINLEIIRGFYLSDSKHVIFPFRRILLYRKEKRKKEGRKKMNFRATIINLLRIIVFVRLLISYRRAISAYYKFVLNERYLSSSSMINRSSIDAAIELSSTMILHLFQSRLKIIVTRYYSLLLFFLSLSFFLSRIILSCV